MNNKIKYILGFIIFVLLLPFSASIFDTTGSFWETLEVFYKMEFFLFVLFFAGYFSFKLIEDYI